MKLKNGKEITIELLKEFESQRLSEQEIASHFEISRPTLWRVRKELNYRRPFRSDRGKVRGSIDERRGKRAEYMREYRKRLAKTN